MHVSLQMIYRITVERALGDFQIYRRSQSGQQVLKKGGRVLVSLSHISSIFAKQ